MGRTNDHIINHVAILLDRSGSMEGRQTSVISVTDGIVAWLDKRSMSDDHETRVSLYPFDHGIECAVFDRDVRRLPSVKNHYVNHGGGTALIDATLKVIDDLKQTAQMYGDHAFLLFLVTDGAEIHSKARASDLAHAIGHLPGNWTLAALVPDLNGRRNAEQFGFPAGNIDIWDTSGYNGVAEVGQKITDGLDTYMNLRSGGVKSTTGLFTQVANKVTAQAVNASGMKPLDPDKFFLFPAVATGNMAVHIPAKTRLKSRPDGIKHVEIKQMVESTGRPYVLGNAFYELEKSEKWYGNRRIAVIETATAKVFLGEQAKQLVGITDQTRRIKPFPKDRATGKVEFEVFIESQSTNRLLRVGSRVLLLK